MNNPLTKAQITSLSKKEFLADNDTINLYDWLQQALDILDIATLPSQTSNSGKYLTTDGTTTSWGTVTIPAAVTPGGSTTQIQYNNAGAFGGSSKFVFNATPTATSAGLKLATNLATSGAASVVPMLFLDTFAAGASATWGANGTIFGIHSISAIANAIDIQSFGTSFFKIDGQGNSQFGATSGSRVSIKSPLVLNLELTTAPANASATGTAGDIKWDSSYIYICTATNTWKRVAIATW